MIESNKILIKLKVLKYSYISMYTKYNYTYMSTIFILNLIPYI